MCTVFCLTMFFFPKLLWFIIVFLISLSVVMFFIYNITQFICYLYSQLISWVILIFYSLLLALLQMSSISPSLPTPSPCPPHWPSPHWCLCPWVKCVYISPLANAFQSHYFLILFFFINFVGMMKSATILIGDTPF